MKKVAHYRRSGRKAAGGPSKFVGLREKMVWMLSPDKRMTGQQIADRLGITLVELNKALGSKFLGEATSNVEATEKFSIPGQLAKDRTYWLKAKPQRLAPKTTKAQNFCISKKHDAEPERRQENIERAARRARLIAQGLYIDEFEATL